MSDPTVLAAWIAAAAALIGVCIGGIISGITVWLQGKAESRRLERNLAAQKEQFLAQLNHEKEQTNRSARRVCYAESLSAFTKLLKSVMDKKDYPECENDPQETSLFHNRMNSLLLLGSKEVNELRIKFIDAYPKEPIEDPNSRKERVSELKKIWREMQKKMREDIGIIS